MVQGSKGLPAIKCVLQYALLRIETIIFVSSSVFPAAAIEAAERIVISPISNLLLSRYRATDHDMWRIVISGHLYSFINMHYICRSDCILHPPKKGRVDDFSTHVTMCTLQSLRINNIYKKNIKSLLGLKYAYLLTDIVVF